MRVAEGFHPDLSVSVPNHWAKHKNTSANPPKTQGIIECMERRLTAEDCLVGPEGLDKMFKNNDLDPPTFKKIPNNTKYLKIGFLPYSAIFAVFIG